MITFYWTFYFFLISSKLWKYLFFLLFIAMAYLFLTIFRKMFRVEKSFFEADIRNKHSLKSNFFFISINLTFFSTKSIISIFLQIWFNLVLLSCCPPTGTFSEKIILIWGDLVEIEDVDFFSKSMEFT